MADIEQFLKETNAEIKKLQDKQASEAKKVILTGYAGILDASPVDTSLFKHNNIISANRKDETEQGNNPINIANSQEVIKNAKLMHNDFIMIQNNLKYAEAIEAGHSKQAPAGVYGVVEEKLRRHLGKRIVIK